MREGNGLMVLRALKTKNYLEKHSKELVGRQITIEKLRFNVLNGKLRIDRIAMLEPDDSTTFASLGNFYTRIHLLPLLRQRIHIDAVLIDKPYLNVYQDGTSFNFDDLLNRFLTPADTVDVYKRQPRAYRHLRFGSWPTARRNRGK